MPENMRKLSEAKPADSTPVRIQRMADRLAAVVGLPVLCLVLEGGKRLKAVGVSGAELASGLVLDLADHLALDEAMRRREPVFLEGDDLAAFEEPIALLVPWGDAHWSGALLIPGASPGEKPRTTIEEIVGAIARHTSAIRETAGLERQVAELEQTAAAFRLLVEGTSDPVKVVDLDGRVRIWNSASEQLFGYTASEVVGHVLPHVPPEDRPRSVRSIRASAALGQEQVREVRCVRKDGSLLNVEMQVLPLADSDGLPVGMFSIVRRVLTDTRLDQMQTDFMSLVTQELKNPLTAILGYAQLLSRPEVRDDPAKRARTVAALERRATDMSALVDDLLLASRVDRNELQLRRSATVLPALVSDAVAAFEPSAPRHRFVIDTDTRMPPANVDAQRVSQALTRLLSNAVKHSKAADEIVVKAVRDGSFAAVSVTDHGEGIAAEDISRVFDRFYKSGGNRQDPGIGLGLYLVRTIVEAHGGAVTVVSKPAKGTTFTMRLPLTPP